MPTVVSFVAKPVLIAIMQRLKISLGKRFQWHDAHHTHPSITWPMPHTCDWSHDLHVLLVVPLSVPFAEDAQSTHQERYVDTLMEGQFKATFSHKLNTGRISKTPYWCLSEGQIVFSQGNKFVASKHRDLPIDPHPPFPTNEVHVGRVLLHDVIKPVTVAAIFHVVYNLAVRAQGDWGLVRKGQSWGYMIRTLIWVNWLGWLGYISK